ncbi:LysR substrate-binding domain-containing protein [Pseudonocardia sp.]|uniref:LysR substrate-binding domain-containing protein n=1 Tax=Pseudonocardia sp. TaxID=60912 RepID=UPI003D0E8E1D
MHLRRLQYFVAVAEELSFTRAAARLHMAQPPLSVQIKALEADLGVTLFDRTSRSVTLTPAGRALLTEARRVLREIDEMTRIVQAAGDGSTGRLVIGFVPSAANLALPYTLRRYRRTYPRVELSLHERTPDTMIRQMHERRIDVGFLYAPFADDSLASQCASTEALVAALPERHPLADDPVVDLNALTREPLILPAQYEIPGLFSQIRLLLERAGATPPVVQREVWMIQTIIGLVAAEIGVAIVPSSVATVPRPGVVYRQIDQASTPVELVMVWRRDNLSPTLRGFVDSTADAPLDLVEILDPRLASPFVW